MGMLLDFVFGRVNFECNESDTESCINELHRNGILAKKMKRENEKFSFFIRLSKYKKVRSLLDKSGIKVYSIRGEGLPFFLMRYKKRYGVIVGALVFCVLLYTSKNYVWQITFSGNENISDSAVEKELLDIGFGVGTYIPSVDYYDLCNSFLQRSEDFSFISVNMEGTTAKVELRERKKRNEDKGYFASNLVAKYSGQIESMTVYSGKTVVEKESVVKEGDLLVSGFYEKAYGFDIIRSTGCVYAYVTREFEVYVPFEKTVKTYTNNRQTKSVVSFFGRDIDIYSDIKNNFEKYDEVIDRERLVLFDRVRLPLVLTKTSRLEYTEETIKLDEDGARKEAELQLSKILTEELKDSEVLERSVEETVTDKGYKLKCKVYCITDIALEKEIQTEKNNT
ncbi:MAG: sporulation protein YqfD [Clostridia bacterium]|nr:sporulation protein YqfD [Clostridia bacterium]